jgi:xylono-1,5-lactonase
MLHDKAPFIRFAADWGFPDGMTVDGEGYLWLAHWNGGRIIPRCDDPDGALDLKINLPVSRITSYTFAGSELNRLFVTSAREGCTNEKLAGALFELNPGVTGMSSGLFAG